MTEESHTFRARAEATHGLDLTIEELPAGTQTPAEAATAIGCEPGQIARSLVFIADVPLVAVTSGVNEVDTRTLATLRGVHTARLADPDEVEDIVGYEIGSVPPFCHDQSVPVYLDEQLTEFDTVWAGAGAPTAVFAISPDRLRECAEATVADITE